MKGVSIYLAGGLFNVGERARNSELEKHLIETAREREIDLHTTLPQRKALNRFLPTEQRFNVAGIVSDCELDAASHDYILCNLDGADADSGTAVELGVARGQALAISKMGLEIKVPKIIIYRTDFRTDTEREVGVNAMLRPEGAEFIYHPCYATELAEFDEFYKGLASEIVGAIQKDLR